MAYTLNVVWDTLWGSIDIDIYDFFLLFPEWDNYFPFIIYSKSVTSFYFSIKNNLSKTIAKISDIILLTLITVAKTCIDF